MQHPLEEPFANSEESLVAQIVSWNEQLESVLNTSTNRAFNLGCFIGLFPAFILVLMTYLLAGKSWVGAAVMLVLMSLALILFANVIAGITRQNTMKRFFQEKIYPEIDQMLLRQPVDSSDLTKIATESLPPGSSLLVALAESNFSPGPECVDEQ